jgi:hypothetical protein
VYCRFIRQINCIGWCFHGVLFRVLVPALLGVSERFLFEKFQPTNILQHWDYSFLPFCVTEFGKPSIRRVMTMMKHHLPLIIIMCILSDWDGDTFISRHEQGCGSLIVGWDVLYGGLIVPHILSSLILLAYCRSCMFIHRPIHISYRLTLHHIHQFLVHP